MAQDMGNKVEPIHAHGFFWVSQEGLVNQNVIFDYFDEKEYYFSLSHKPNEYEKEMIKLFHSMQNMLNQEKVLINDIICMPKVRTVSLDFRGSENLPTIIFFITFKGQVKNGLNVYENYYEKGIVEYDYEAYWVFPETTKILGVESSILYEIVSQNILIMKARKGDKYFGYEKIVFDMGSC